METDRLKQFKVIADTGGLLRASEILGISGGGLSKSMKALERELGYSIFIQRGRGIELTEAGRKLYELLPSALSAVEGILHLKKDLIKNDEFLRIVSFEVFTTYFLASAVSRFFPNRSIDIREAIPAQMETLIAEEKSDFGITYMPIPHSGVEFIKTGKIRMRIYGNASLKKTSHTKDIPFVVPVAPIQGTPSGVKGLDGWPDHLFERKIKYRVEMMETAIQLCHRGQAVLFIPEFIAKIVNEQVRENFFLEEVSLPKQMEEVFRDVFLIVRRGYTESQDVRLLAKAMRTLK